MRRYIEGGKRPPKLISNWPDLPAPRASHEKHWRYRIRRDDGSLVYEDKDYHMAVDYYAMAKRQSSVRLLFEKYEPTAEELAENRLTEKALWRWNAGFGA